MTTTDKLWAIVAEEPRVYTYPTYNEQLFAKALLAVQAECSEYAKDDQCDSHEDIARNVGQQRMAKHLQAIITDQLKELGE